MKSTLTITILLLGLLLPFLLMDGRRYRVLLIAIILLLPFYQVFIYLRYFTCVLAFIMIRQRDDTEMLGYRNEPINRWLLVFFLAALLSPLMMGSMTASTTAALFDLMFFYVFFLVCIVACRRQLGRPQLPLTMLGGLLTAVFIQTMQLLGIKAFYIYDEKMLNANTGMLYESEDQLLRYWGPFGNSLTFSSYLAVVGVLLFVYYRNSLSRFARLLSYGILLVTLFGIALTAGRTAFVSVVAGLVFYAYLKSWKRALIVTVSLVVLLWLGLGIIEHSATGNGISLYTRFTNLGEDKSYRTEIWTRALPVFLRNPLFGTGPGNLTPNIAPLINQIYFFEKDTLALTWGHVESTYLTVLYTFGVIGFFCFGYMLVRSFLYSLRTCRQASLQPVKQLAYGVTTAWVVMAINMISNPIFVTDYRTISLMLLLVALSIAMGWRSQAPARARTPVVRPAPMQQPVAG